jgi:hypothetical protein
VRCEVGAKSHQLGSNANSQATIPVRPKQIAVVPLTRPTPQNVLERSDSNILKISTPLILVSTTVFKFFVFDHENSQIKILKNY